MPTRNRTCAFAFEGATNTAANIRATTAIIAFFIIVFASMHTGRNPSEWESCGVLRFANQSIREHDDNAFFTSIVWRISSVKDVCNFAIRLEFNQCNPVEKESAVRNSAQAGDIGFSKEAYVATTILAELSQNSFRGDTKTGSHVQIEIPRSVLSQSPGLPRQACATKETQSMKRFIAITSMLALSTGMLMAQDGATLFKKCAACHGANGEGKMGPSIKGKDVTDVLTNGGKKGPHAARFAGLTDDQIKTVAAYVKGLQ